MEQIVKYPNMESHFHKLSKQLFFPLCLLLLMINATAQDDVCEESGYFLSFAASAPECAGDASGTVTVATPGCYCMFSGCTYEWSNGSSFHTVVDLFPGIYEVVVTHPNGCVLTGEVEVPDAVSYLASEEVKDIVCKGANDGSIKLNPFSNFEGLLTYQWSNGSTEAEVTGLASGDYAVTVNNFDGCSMVKSFTISEPEEELDFQYETVASCMGMENGAINVSITGGVPPYIILCDGTERSDPEMSSVIGGLHSVVVKDANDCTKEVEVMVEEVQISTPEILASNPSICQGSVTSLSAFGGSGLTYEWSPQEGISNPYSNLVTANPAETTTYNLEVTNSEGCKGSSSIVIEVKSCNEEEEEEEEEEETNTAIEELPVEQQINIYPIPAKDFIILDFDATYYNQASIELVDLSGRTINHFNNLSNRMDISSLNNGVYLLKIEQGNEILVKKFIKR